MKTHLRRRSLEFLPVAIGVVLILFGLLAGGALAATGGMDGMTDEQMQAMDGMDGMTADEMQGMTSEEMQAMHAADASGGTQDAHAAGTGAHAGMAGMDMGGGSVNWLVIGGFIALVAGSTIAAVMTKRHLRRRESSGELAGAGAQDV
jgi:hypothetical protein